MRARPELIHTIILYYAILYYNNAYPTIIYDSYMVGSPSSYNYDKDDLQIQYVMCVLAYVFILFQSSLIGMAGM